MSNAKEKLLNLVNAYKDGPYAEDDLKFIESSMNYFVNYVNSVVMMEYKMPLLRARLDGQDLRDSIQDLDGKRRTAHECAISSCKWLNNLSTEKGLEVFYPGDIKDRYAVADFVGETVMDFYKEAIDRARYKTIDDLSKDGKTFDKISLDEVIEKCKNDYDKEAITSTHNDVEAHR